ncbi:MAG TPA: transketolase, partial [candidate division Zixibacteria bacterium]|nr:transketolase [candidate division Zixibacteria bacterium]
AGDGDLMEGIAYEAASLAGHLKLGKLIVLYDDNEISLAGSTSLSFTEDVTARFEAAGWQVLVVEDGNDINAIDKAIAAGKAESDMPTLIRVKTVIGYGSPKKAGSYHSHGAPLGEDELAETKKALGWDHKKAFFVPDDVRNHFESLANSAKEARFQWNNLFESFESKFSDNANELRRRFSGDIPEDLFDDIPMFEPEEGPIATRVASEKVMQKIGERLPDLFGGCADLNPSTFAWLKDMGDFQPVGCKPDGVQGEVGGDWSYRGRNIHFGVREHAMGAMAVGMTLHGGIIPFTGTFFIFSDYMRPPMRLAALSKLRTIFVFSHDSIGVGEDGPTHQPIEQLMSLRVVPNLNVIRPADANEVIEAWKIALENKNTPTALVFSRQKLPVLDREKYMSAEGLARGAYVIWQSGDGTPDLIIIATGSEVNIALTAAEKLADEGANVRVVSMPCWSIFEQQDNDYREMVLPRAAEKRIAVEAGIRIGWEKFVGNDGIIIGMDSFGASAPGNQLFEKFGITAQAVYSAAKSIIEKGD